MWQNAVPWARTSASLCWWKEPRPKSYQQAKLPDNSNPKSLTPLSYTKLGQNSVITMPGKVTTSEKFTTQGLPRLSPAQSHILTSQEEGIVATTRSLEGAIWTKVFIFMPAARTSPACSSIQWGFVLRYTVWATASLFGSARTTYRTDKQPGTEHLYRNSRWHFSRNNGEGTRYLEDLW